MKILTIHSDYLTVNPKKKAIKDANEFDKKILKEKECLIVFTAVEKSDEEHLDSVIRRYVKEIDEIAKQVQTKTIVLYPYVHLTSNPSKPSAGKKLLEEGEKLLKKKKYKCSHAPFGWYKSFELKCKGHPLSELSREFGSDVKTEENEALKAEEKLKSDWYILDSTGKRSKLKLEKGKVIGFNFSKFKNLGKFTNYEMVKVRVAKQEPPHVALMKKLELVDYEPGSDPGNLRYYPQGRFIKSLIEMYVSQRVQEYGGMEIESPIMYDFEHPSLKSYMNRFPARQYTINTPNKKVFLRFAACFGQFLMLHDANISYKQLPLKLYELTRYSFRVEQRGELTGLRRLRAFTMPDCHAFAADLKQAKEEMLTRFKFAKKLQEEMGFEMPNDMEFAIRVTKQFWEKNKDFIISLVKEWGKPALIEMWNDRFFYFSMKYEWNFVDALDKASALTTDQIDVENAERYGIYYIDKKGHKKHPLILHQSPSGAIERVIYAFLEKAYMDSQKGKVAQLPLWLNPTQIRLIPIDMKKHLKYCENLAKEFEQEKVRVDIDDREMSMGKKIRQAGLRWVPYTLVIGDEEMSSDKLAVRVRETGKQEKYTKDKLVKEIHNKTKGLPFKPIPVPKMLSKRPIFYSTN